MSSANVELVRSIYAAWERGDFTSSDWAHADIEFAFADGPAPGSSRGVAAMSESWRDYLSLWYDARVESDEYRELDDEHVLVLNREYGEGRTSGLNTSDVHARGANLFQIRDGKVVKLVLYLTQSSAFADLGLTE
jgi:ketosteroid isomerase-like protein